MTKKEAMTPEPPVLLFEQIMRGSGLFCDSADWHELMYSCHVDWLKPLLAIGAIEHIGSHPAWEEGENRSGRPNFNYHDYKITPEGIQWWVSERIREEGPADPAIIANHEGRPIEWRGIGAILHFYGVHMLAALCGVHQGLFEFLDYNPGGPPRIGRMNESVTVRLTRKGYDYFSALPRLELECA